MKLLRRESHAFVLLCLWVAGIAGGTFAVTAYSTTPTPAHQPSWVWPLNSGIKRKGDRPTLLLLLHPKCTCSHASIVELSQLLAQSPTPVDVKILLYEPKGAQASWNQGSLVDEARSIPGVMVTTDPGGIKASYFGMSVSGQTALYATNGALLFSGGITAARGHSGANAGHTAILNILSQVQPATHRTPVFGCSIWDAS